MVLLLLLLLGIAVSLVSYLPTQRVKALYGFVPTDRQCRLAGIVGPTLALVSLLLSWRPTQLKDERAPLEDRVGFLDPVGAFVRQRMQPGSAAFFIPSPVQRGEPVEAALTVSAPSISPDELQQELERLAARVGVGASGSIHVASRMAATLVTDRESTIVLKDPADQAVSLPDGATWRWTVTPKARGTTRATVTLTAPVVIDGRETFYRVRSFERTVTVTVTGSDVASDALTWARDYWVILVAIGTGLGGLAAWLRKRRQRTRRAGFR